MLLEDSVDVVIAHARGQILDKKAMKSIPLEIAEMQVRMSRCCLSTIVR